MDAPAGRQGKEPGKTHGKVGSRVHTQDKHIFFFASESGNSLAKSGRSHPRQEGAEETRAAAGRDSQEIKGRVQDTLEQAPC